MKKKALKIIFFIICLIADAVITDYFVKEAIKETSYILTIGYCLLAALLVFNFFSELKSIIKIKEKNNEI